METKLAKDTVLKKKKERRRKGVGRVISKQHMIWRGKKMKKWKKWLVRVISTVIF